jgi:hypothetical protein
MRRGWRQGGTPADHVGRFLRNHKHARVDVRGNEIGHDGRIYDAQSFNAENAQLRVDDRADGACAAGMMRRDRSLAEPFVDVACQTMPFGGAGAR